MLQVLWPSTALNSALHPLWPSTASQRPRVVMVSSVMVSMLTVFAFCRNPAPHRRISAGIQHNSANKVFFQNVDISKHNLTFFQKIFYLFQSNKFGAQQACKTNEGRFQTVAQRAEKHACVVHRKSLTRTLCELR